MPDVVDVFLNEQDHPNSFGSKHCVVAPTGDGKVLFFLTGTALIDFTGRQRDGEYTLGVDLDPALRIAGKDPSQTGLEIEQGTTFAADLAFKSLTPACTERGRYDPIAYTLFGRFLCGSWAKQS